MERTVSSLNSALSKPLPSNLIEKVTPKWWPDLEERIKEIDKELDLSDGVEKTTQSERELLEDILNSVRSLTRIAVGQIWEANELSLAHLAQPMNATQKAARDQAPSEEGEDENDD